MSWGIMLHRSGKVAFPIGITNEVGSLIVVGILRTLAPQATWGKDTGRNAYINTEYRSTCCNTDPGRTEGD